jgi:molybdenum cofactor cytidylyltransferase
MKLSQLTPKDAIGHLSVHAHKLIQGKIRKGQIITASDADDLTKAGIDAITCAVAEKGDIDENAAADRLAKHLTGSGIIPGQASTGRINFTTEHLGIVRYNRDTLSRINAIDEGITLALVQHNQLLAPGDMIATLKIIPFFVSYKSVSKVEEVLSEDPLFTLHPLASKKIGLIQSRFPHQSDNFIAATERVTAARADQLGCSMIGCSTVAHDKGELSAAIKAASDAGAEVILIAGASAIADRHDVIPEAVIDAGGVVDHFGLAVDPGNLLMLGHLDKKLVIGMPGCSRSPKLNGLDWVLQLHLASIQLDRGELAEMAAGGLLMEIASRPMPRALVAQKPKKARIEGVLLAAGLSNRMGDENKLLADIAGTPMIRHIAETMKRSRLDTITVILGHDADAVAAALDGIEARLVFNPDYRKGQSTSLLTALNHLDASTSDLMVFLGDMPLVDTAAVDRLIEAHTNAENRPSCITLPVVDGQRGNPVIWGESFFAEIADIKGDTGARPLFEVYQTAINAVPFDGPELLFDANTPESFDLLHKKLARN